MNPHDRYRQSKSAFAEQFNREVPHDGNVVERANVAPLGIYDNGKIGLAFPQRLVDAWDVWGRAVDGARGEGPGTKESELFPAANALASFAGTGSMAFGRPAKSLGAGGRWIKPDDKAEITRLIQAGARGSDIARQFGLSRAAVSNIKRETGIKEPGRADVGVMKLSTRDENQIANALQREGVDRPPISDIADLYGITNADVVRIGATRFGRDVKGYVGGIPTEGNEKMSSDQRGNNYLTEFLNSRMASRTSQPMANYMTGGNYAGDTSYWPESRFDGPEIRQNRLMNYAGNTPPTQMMGLDQFRMRYGRDPATDSEMMMVYGGDGSPAPAQRNDHGYGQAIEGARQQYGNTLDRLSRPLAPLPNGQQFDPEYLREIERARQYYQQQMNSLPPQR